MKEYTNKKPVSKKKEKGIIEEIDSDVNKFIEETGQQITTGLRQLLIGLFLLLIGLSLGYIAYANYTYSEGTRAGNLIKVSKKGLLFKTYEGQLKLGGINLNNPDGISDTWNFSVSDRNIVKELEKLQGQKVILRYKEINRALPWQGDTNYFIYAIEK